MYILKNALKNIGRNRGRNILMGAIIFAIILTTVVALIINNTAGNVIENYKDRFTSEVTITVDYQKLMQEAQANMSIEGRRGMAFSRPEISSELLLAFTSSEYLKESVATGQTSANSDEIIAIDQDNSNVIQSAEVAQPGRQNGNFARIMGLGDSGNFRLYGDYWKDFNDGMRNLTDDGISVMPQADNECIISEALAYENNISVGDSLAFTTKLYVPIPSEMDLSTCEDGDVVGFNNENYTLEQFNDFFRASREVTYELLVSGTYIDLTDEYANEYMTPRASMNRLNEILTTLGTLLDKRTTDETGIQVEVKYYLKAPELLSKFESEVRAKGLPDAFLVDTDTASYDNMVKPVLGLKNISLTFMFVVIILGAIILILLSSISIRERKYEIGVLRAMGMKKSKVGLGLLTEMLIITCACLVVGIGVGSVMAQPVSDFLLKTQVEMETAGKYNDFRGFEQGGGMMGSNGGNWGSRMNGMTIRGNNSNIKPISEMEISLGFNTILEIIAIALLLATLAALVSISKITKYEPMKILMERN